jgi:hypothetical protein
MCSSGSVAGVEVAPELRRRLLEAVGQALEEEQAEDEVLVVGGID